ncbi:MAG: hypothetical protein V2I43_18755 [Parvularcula sp.]|nr:hypothetical protein [Parvularcula sp.]
MRLLEGFGLCADAERSYLSPMENQTSRRFSLTGRKALGTAVRLIVASLVVGAFLALLGLNPLEMWTGLFRAIQNGVRDVFNTGVEGIGLILTLIATGAVIVLPIWAVRLLLKQRR